MRLPRTHSETCCPKRRTRVTKKRASAGLKMVWDGRGSRESFFAPFLRSLSLYPPEGPRNWEANKHINPSTFFSLSFPFCWLWAFSPSSSFIRGEIDIHPPFYRITKVFPSLFVLVSSSDKWASHEHREKSSVNRVWECLTLRTDTDHPGKFKEVMYSFFFDNLRAVILLKKLDFLLTNPENEK